MLRRLSVWLVVKRVVVATTYDNVICCDVVGGCHDIVIGVTYTLFMTMSYIKIVTLRARTFKVF